MCINTVAKRYKFLSGLELAITDTVFNEMVRHGEADVELRSLSLSLGRTTFLGNFQRVKALSRRRGWLSFASMRIIELAGR